MQYVEYDCNQAQPAFQIQPSALAGLVNNLLGSGNDH